MTGRQERHRGKLFAVRYSPPRVTAARMENLDFSRCANPDRATIQV